MKPMAHHSRQAPRSQPVGTACHAHLVGRPNESLRITGQRTLATEHAAQFTMRRSDSSACRASEYRGSISRASWK
jgi:hypothetical protein